MNKLIKKIGFINIVIAAVIAIFFIGDRYLKLRAINLTTAAPIRLAGDIFTYTFKSNYYIAFSLPLGGTLLNGAILILVIVLIATITLFILSKNQHRLEISGLALILLGAISNLADRLIYGYVIDYFYLKNFTIFNLADVMISSGALILILNSFKKK